MTTPKSVQLQRGFAPLTRGSAPGPRWGHSPQTLIRGSRSALAIWPPPNCTPGSAPVLYSYTVTVINAKLQNAISQGQI